MQESKSPHNPRGSEVIRHRVRSRLRARFVVPAAVVLAGLSLAGVSAAVTGGGEEVAPSAAAVTADQQARQETAGRANRAQRSTTSPKAASPRPTTAAPTTKAPAATPKKATARAPKATRAPAWVNPMPGGAVTSCYGMRWGVLHAGLDLAAASGTPLHAVGAGTVVAAGWAYSGYGISVVIDHGNGFLTHYAHQSRVAVSVGQKVSAGQTIGYEGSTGDSTGPHLHFEVHQGMWKQINPAPWLRARGVSLSC